MEMIIQIATLVVAAAGLVLELRRELRRERNPPEVEPPEEEL